jgi:hypothetical protein
LLSLLLSRHWSLPRHDVVLSEAFTFDVTVYTIHIAIGVTTLVHIYHSAMHHIIA